MFSLILFWCCVFCGIASIKSGGQTFYVSPSGSDANPGTMSAPFQSPAAAQAAVRAANSAQTGDIAVYLADGTYRLNAPLVFNAADSGKNGCRILYKAVLGQSPVLNGGILISNWTLFDAGKNIWRAAVPPGRNFRQLYVNGVKANLARSADALGLVTNSAGYLTTNALLRSMTNSPSLANLEVVTIPNVFQQEILPVAAIAANGQITLQQPCWSMVTNIYLYPSYYAPVWLQNAYEFLTNSGDWYLQTSSNLVYYIPRASDNMATAVSEAPVLERLIYLQGVSNNPVANLRFEGITFEMATWLFPGPGYGLPESQANQPENTTSNWVMKAAVDGAWLCNVDVSQCQFRHLGGDGVNVLAGSKNVAVDHCQFYDLAGTAVQLALGWQPDGTVSATDPSIMENVVVANNVIHDVCTEYLSGCGIFVGYTRNCSILHNHIYNLPYSGISMGWGWAKMVCSFNSGNWIDGNVIHDHLRAMNDGGAIYANGTQIHATISHNYAYNQQNNYWGTLYLDDGASNWSVFENVATKGGATAWMNYKGTNNHIYLNYSDNAYVRSPSSTRSTCNNNTVVTNANWALNPAAAAITNDSGPRANVYYSSLPAACLINETYGNGNFSQGLTGWTLGGPASSQTGVGWGYYADPNTPTGSSTVFFNGGNNPPGATLSTAFNAVAGHVYALAYSQATWGAANNQSLAVSVADATGTNTLSLGTNTTWATGLYARFGATFTATNAGVWTLTFSDMTTPANGTNSDSAIARVELRDVTFVPDVALSVQPSPGGVILRWPTAATGFSLYASPALGLGAAWSLVTSPTPAPDPANTNLLKIILPAVTRMFFRLQK